MYEKRVLVNFLSNDPYFFKDLKHVYSIFRLTAKTQFKFY